jgi:general secretion pathway protein G
MIRQRLRTARANDNGFTLIELLIVVTILGVLSGIVVFAVSKFQSDGVTAACKADLKTVETAAEAYYAKNSFAYVDVAALVTAGYLKEAPPTTENIKVNLTTGAVTGNC